MRIVLRHQPGHNQAPSDYERRNKIQVPESAKKNQYYSTFSNSSFRQSIPFTEIAWKVFLF